MALEHATQFCDQHREESELMMPPQRAVRGRPARWNIEEQRVSNAPEVKTKGEVTNAEFWEAIRMLSQVVTNKVGQQRGARQEETDTLRIQMVVDMRSTMSLFMARISRLSSKEGKVAILIRDMDIARLMVYVQQVEGEKLRDRKEFRNKKAKTWSESGQQRNNNFRVRPTQSQSSKAQGGNWAPAYAKRG
ncbi:uncharacterized protein LOC125829384 [Solanum verrucosum]|uniref:uncharacterized protein LOC125829384 n=1 Tax=Solanum verrucosum TaxID=315347 RepID=UPI0020D09133|nr:uncharacterized protein LOC125829384 [Solanum verrucosum]